MTQYLRRNKMNDNLSYFGYNSRLWYSESGGKMVKTAKEEEFTDHEIITYDIIGIILGLLLCILIGCTHLIALSVMTGMIYIAFIMVFGGTWLDDKNPYSIIILSGIEVFIGIVTLISGFLYLCDAIPKLGMIIIIGANIITQILRILFAI